MERKLVVLVVGAAGEDSGKTVLSASLASALRSQGVRTALFKPYGATSVWAHPEVLAESARRRVLVTMDALTFESVLPDLPVETVNPVALHVGVPDYSRNEWRPGPAATSLGPERLSVLGRVSRCGAERVDTLHFINLDALDRVPRSLQEALIDTAAALRPLPVRAGDSLVESVLSGAYNAEVESCLARLIAGHDVVIIESNSDVPMPVRVPPTLVLVVAPGVVGIVGGERYVRSLEALGATIGWRYPPGYTVGEVLRLSGVEETVSLPILEEKGELYRRSQLERVVERITRLLAAPP